MFINDKIFRAYDIRGKVKDEVTAQLCYAVGRALGSKFLTTGEQVVLGRDVRLHSRALSEAMSSGLRAQGIHVIDIGEVTTPILYFASHHFGCAAAVMVTGSHNPIDENGLKIVVRGHSIARDQVQEIKALVKDGDFRSLTTEGRLEQRDVFDSYANALLACVKLGQYRRPIVVDAGNGAAGPYIVKLLQNLGIPHIALFCEPDGRFPNHHPDPGKAANMRALQNAVLKSDALFGLAFDGDGDRLGLVDERGQIVSPDRLLILFARQVLKRVPGATIIADVKCSQITYDEIERAGGKPLMWKTGHSLIKAKMRETGAALAGEMSGHYFFGEPWIGVDDALYAALSLCEIADGKPISTQFEGIATAFATPELRVSCPDALKFQIVEELKDAYKELYSVCELDGARIDFPGAWALLRASNTEAALVLRVEAQSAEACRALFVEFSAKCQSVARKHGVELDFGYNACAQSSDVV
ncbi:MAG: phosphomannomutase/phosphoglucomutase [Bradymonadia bacterium]|jgi:phosphomannomutase/phosphoglucomutase